MTPNNIINMAYIKGLDVISVTDHNTMLNAKVVSDLGKDKGILVIPGIEVTTKEEVHVLCYFDDLNKGLEFSDLIYKSLPMVKNKSEIFGKQTIFDIEDMELGEVEKLLLNSTSYTIKEISELVRKYDGLMVPAHIDKEAYSILSTLGFVPSDINITTIEVTKKFDEKKVNAFIDVNKYNILRSSDAHYLQHINEREYFIYPEEKTLASILNWLS